MKSVRYTWPKALEQSVKEQIDTWAKELELDPYAVELLWRRGLTTKLDMEELLDAQQPTYHHPDKLFDMDRAVERILSAIASQEIILIYGDYDADGMTSTSILYETLEQLGAHVLYYLPNRFTDGYGPNLEVYRYFQQQGVSLIITVDNGVGDKDAIESIQSQGVDVIVTDHHEIPDLLPKAYAIIHPRHPLGTYPFGDLSGAGVAFKLAHALLGELPVELLDLAAIGTVADLVSLTDENRTLVKQGLSLMNQSPRMGIQSLLQVSGFKNGETVDEQTIGFKIAPRLNALGRLDDPNPAVALLTALDGEIADELAQQMEKINQERVDLVEETTDRCFDYIANHFVGGSLPKILVLYQPDFHVGILGIVASRLVEKFTRPVIIFGDSNASNEIKGSGRSIPTIDLYQLLNQASSSILYFGGHAGAAGLTIDRRYLQELTIKLEKVMNTYDEEQLIFETSVDLHLPVNHLTKELIYDFKKLGPFGTGFKTPLVGVSSVQLTDSRTMGANQAHFKAQIKTDLNQSIEVLGFNFGGSEKQLSHSNALNLVGELDINTWRGEETPQMRLKGFEVIGKIWMDQRKSKLDPEILKLKKSLYIYETTKIGELLKEYLDQSSDLVSYTELEFSQLEKEYDKQIFLECPLIPMDNRYKDPIKYYSDEIWIVMHRFYHYLERSIPKTEDFKRLYKILYRQESISFKQLNTLEKPLRIRLNDLKWMIKVFSELKFVTIENGQIVRVVNPVQRSIESSHLYQLRMQAIEEEQFFQFQPLEEIIKVLSN